ncbi:MAG: hypothetical protein HYZ65_14570 [Burkholderiales bacterium]|nr:hypothetical protein [Burkholderiales bacterium]
MRDWIEKRLKKYAERNDESSAHPGARSSRPVQLPGENEKKAVIHLTKISGPMSSRWRADFGAV